MPYVYSTLTADTKYTGYKSGGGDLPVIAWQVLIAGGANVARKNLTTPYGLATKVSEDELKLLMNDSLFNLHKDNGFIRVSEADEDADKVAADMTGRDESAPLVPQDFDPEDDKIAQPMDIKPKGGKRK